MLAEIAHTDLHIPSIDVTRTIPESLLICSGVLLWEVLQINDYPTPNESSFECGEGNDKENENATYDPLCSVLQDLSFKAGKKRSRKLVTFFNRQLQDFARYGRQRGYHDLLRNPNGRISTRRETYGILTYYNIWWKLILQVQNHPPGLSIHRILIGVLIQAHRIYWTILEPNQRSKTFFFEWPGYPVIRPDGVNVIDVGRSTSQNCLL